MLQIVGMKDLEVLGSKLEGITGKRLLCLLLLILMPEEIKTFDEWKREGYIVQKGQHAVARFQIWMPKKGKVKKQEQEGDDVEMAARGFYKKVAFFFTIDQVKKFT